MGTTQSQLVPKGFEDKFADASNESGLPALKGLDVVLQQLDEGHEGDGEVTKRLTLDKNSRTEAD